MTDFADIVRIHRARYPLMQPQDYGKLAFQSEFGPEHMVADERSAAENILLEWHAVNAAEIPRNPEPISGNLCRFHLTKANFSEENAAALARLFIRSARKHTGSGDGLKARLDVLARLDIRGMGAWLEAYRKQGCPPVHHSEAFRGAYSPHYRVLLTALAEDFLMLCRQ